MKEISNIVKQPLVMTIQLDEMQEDPIMAQEILRVIADYMCSTSVDMPAPSWNHQILVYPIITGTSKKEFNVTPYGSISYDLKPFNWEESLEYVRLNAPTDVYNKIRSEPQLKRLLKACGGVPRLLFFFVKNAIESIGNGTRYFTIY